MLSQNWSAKLEYLYLNFGSHTFLAGTGFDTNIKLSDNIVRLGLNYKFITH
jgi:outer membrane immunogenic protein